MAEPSKQQIGDGSDNYGQAAGQMAKAARQSGQEAVKQTAAKGAEQASNAAAATVKASVEGVTPTAVYAEMAGAVSDVVDDGYSQALAKVESMISDGGYDYDLSMEALVNYAQSSSGYDVSYILAAYSASMQQQNTKKEDMVSKLGNVAGSMFPVTSEEKQKEIIIPVTYYTYQPVTLTVVTDKVKTGTVNGVAQYRYETAEKTYYLPDESHTSNEPVEIDAYKSVTVSLPVYSGGAVTGTTEETYYQADGKETVTPGTETIKYIECTIHPFDNAVIATAFGLNLDAPYEQFGITYGEAIQKMATALKMTLYGIAGNGQSVPLTDAELIAFVNRQNCNATRKHILTTALSLVGKVPYFWGGKSGP